jgi:hypothetical protein
MQVERLATGSSWRGSRCRFGWDSETEKPHRENSTGQAAGIFLIK